MAFKNIFHKYRYLIGSAVIGLAAFLTIGLIDGTGLAGAAQSATNKTTVAHTRTEPVVERLSGKDAIHTSVAVSQKYFSASQPVAYVVNRSAYPDGIVATSMKQKGPILYTNQGSLPAAVAAELTRLKPKKVIIVGGADIVDNNVVTAIKKVIPSTSPIKRLSGADRFATATAVSKANYPNGSNLVYIANGSAYADAIIATQQATQAPLLYASTDSIKAVTINEIKRLKATKVIIVGGADIVSNTVAQNITKQTGATVTRVSGPNRYDTAVALSKTLYPNGIDQVYVTAGDAYADSILVGSLPTKGAMLYVNSGTPEVTMTELQRLGATRAFIIGGEIRVSQESANKIKQIMRGSQILKRLGTGVSYFVLAHPDDEIASWAAVKSSTYPVFILSTQGENSTHCTKNGGKGSQQCRDRRISSWHKFLDNYYTVTDRGMQSGGFHLYTGPNSARLIFDLGDGNLTAEEVTDAINKARQVDYGIPTENYIATGNYWDTKRAPGCTKDDYACGLYDHADHRAVYDAIARYQHPNKLSFHGHYNPLVNAGANMGYDLFESMIACPNGTYNQAYSWLNPPCWTRENSRWHHWNWMKEY